MLLNPDQFSIIQSKEMGMWPNGTLIADVMYPYIKRMPTTISILDVGTMKGENAYRFVEIDVKKKIDVIYTEKKTNQYDALIEENLKNLSDKISLEVSKEPFDIVCINSKTNLSETLNQYYSRVKIGGIFCGDGHSETPVKEALAKFRRENRIGIPISIAHDVWFWYCRQK